MCRPAARSVLLALAALAASPAVAQERAATAAPVVAASPVAPTIPTPPQVFAIPPAMHDMLRTQVINRSYSREQRLQALVEMIFDRHGLDLQYDADATLTVSEIWQQRRANCLAFTLMFVALAREAGIQARVQEVGQVVSWYQDQAQGLVYSVGHVNAGVGFADRFATVDLDRNVLYDRRGPLPISQARALAHFYNNRGAERMASGDLTGARAFFNTALAQDAGFAATWNNLGVLENRTGNTAAARRALETALRLDGRQDAALTNASALYRRLGMNVQAQALEQRLQSVQREDPFAQYMLGAEAERAGQLDQAIRHYRQAVRLYDTAHQFHFGLARAYFLAGQLKRADRELLRAQELGGAPQQARYQAKLDSLARWRAQQQARR
ncbi:tetratricopeptide repeat protein [Stenotrophomonas maltophilia]|uniref:UDP-N-acetylglucosamine--peptide N-acetylglucosaminyltransferase SEC n=1 Tax=Stenotrophomonas maltophilia TaxID=40324 RepID=A0AB34TG24_STEMA|nr:MULTISPECIES: transglutaminase-like domain-containing protein [Stenotrophomonas]TGR53964.1 UDP-N-acetylglucosamine-peptide N-acetylglucosaminyltransferase [bacterium M00.F.Ca.ET.199.01.1.1]TGT07334.1 UDP-N-acetylglucosamine-peptide N-acetylglucosaminyltransferase [bacterium M00.F.Ca.ET.177.01.1.1]TGT64583.1 UDP-N-acetylglucosamine-peptide N-acetylglucosaminyltransferase [Mesorhizobium sp. M00.F.Ca.ET.170.01.1.1]TGU14727.1 UDP-N-acetylglucosamine-peptide N-acetylglucosaminyltransferase [bacte